jgi:hypothetical protein
VCQVRPTSLNLAGIVSIGKTCPPTGTCGTIGYAIMPHPEFDPTGKTVMVTWTDANVIHAVQAACRAGGGQ